MLSHHKQSHEDSPLVHKEDIGHYIMDNRIPQLELTTDTSSSSIGTTVPSAPKTLQFSSKRFLISKTSIVFIIVLVVISFHWFTRKYNDRRGNGVDELLPIGPYQLVEAHEGRNFFSYYEFYDGPDSLGSAGFNTYVSQSRAKELGIAAVVSVDNEGILTGGNKEEIVYLSSAPTIKGPRESIRLEGKRRFERGLFILDVKHMPDGCGVWPAFWMTDEDNWPENGEIDVLEGVNGQTIAKTALHTSNGCDMYAHVAPYAKTGDWEWITGIPNTFTGEPDFRSNKPADNCWIMAQHQWENEGCTAVHDRNDTLGAPVNAAGGGIYAMEWDPQNHYIKSWVFSSEIPLNLFDALRTSKETDAAQRVMPDPDTWGLPYAYFAIGDTTGCSANHFKNMHIVLNLAFCGNVSGNRFSRECPELAEKFNQTNAKGEHDPVLTCNAYIESNPKALDNAHWKIKGVYVYERMLGKSLKNST